VTYIYCDICGIGFHSNVCSCPQCGLVARRVHQADGDGHARRRVGWRRARPMPLSEDVESEVREAIYGWRSGTVQRLSHAAPAGRQL
jgi:hypothetical protein